MFSFDDFTTKSGKGGLRRSMMYFYPGLIVVSTIFVASRAVVAVWAGAWCLKDICFSELTAIISWPPSNWNEGINHVGIRRWHYYPGINVETHSLSYLVRVTKCNSASSKENSRVDRRKGADAACLMSVSSTIIPSRHNDCQYSWMSHAYLPPQRPLPVQCYFSFNGTLPKPTRITVSHAYNWLPPSSSPLS